MSAAPLRAWLPALLVSAVAWGSSFLFISLALRAFSPAQVGFGRLVVGATVLIIVCAIRGDWPRFTKRQMLYLVVAAFCMSGAPFVLFPLAQQHVTSILASLLNAATPLWTAVFVAILIPMEKATRAQWFGLGVGAVGIAVLLGAWRVTDFPLLGAALILAATAFYGIGGAFSRRFLASSKNSSVAMVAAQISISVPMLAPFAFADGAPAAGTFAWDSTAMWGLIGLGVFGTSFAYVAFWQVVRTAGATTASAVTYISPVVAVFLGILVLGEHLHWYEPVGAVIVLLGVWLSQRHPKAPKAATPAETL